VLSGVAFIADLVGTDPSGADHTAIRTGHHRLSVGTPEQKVGEMTVRLFGFRSSGERLQSEQAGGFVGML